MRLPVVILLLATLYPAQGFAQRPKSPPVLSVLVWTEQLAPVRSEIYIEGQCLIILIPGDTPYKYPLIIGQSNNFGYALSAGPRLQTTSGLIYQFNIGPWHISSLAPGWLETLSTDFDPALLSGPRCVRSGPTPVRLTNPTLQEIRRSPLFADTLLRLTGPLKANLGWKTTRINSQQAQELAGYDPLRDSVFFSPRNIPSRRHLRYAMLHELGHRFDSQQPGLLNRFVPRPWTPHKYAQDVKEYKADLVAYAVSWISLSRTLTREEREAWRVLFEELLPGSTQVASRLTPWLP